MLPMSSNKKGLLLINIGTPDSASPNGPSVAEVRRYLGQFLMDPFVIDLPWVFRALLVHGIILRTRPKASQEAYHKIWTPQGSPLLIHSFAFAKGVQERLPHFEVALGMCNGNPSIESALRKLANAGVSQIIVAPLFPQYSEATNAGSMYITGKALKKLNWQPKIKEISAFYRQKFFIDTFAHEIRPLVESQKPDLVLFSFHGLPEKHITKADPTKMHCLQAGDCCADFEKHHPNCYKAQCAQTARLLSEAIGLKPGQSTHAFQSRLGRTRWIGPYTDEVLAELPKKGFKNILVVSPSFVADCLETLEEIGMRGRDTFLEAGGKTFSLAPCVNSRQDWIDGFSSWIETL